MSGILILKDLNKGSTLKQGDKTELVYQLADGDGDALNLANKKATVKLLTPDFTATGYEKAGITVGQDNIVRFTIDKVIQARKYYVEIIVDGKFIFPSVEGGRILNIDRSSLGQESNIIEIIGKDKIVSEVKAQVDAEIAGALTTLSQTNDSITQAEEARKQAENERKANEEARNLTSVEEFVKLQEAIGGRNLIKGDTSKVVTDFTPEQGVFTGITFGYQNFKAGVTYTASVDVKVSEGIRALNYNYFWAREHDTGGNQSIGHIAIVPVDGSWYRYSKAFSFPIDRYGEVKFGLDSRQQNVGSGLEYSYKNAKLEKGSHATPYSKAPENYTTVTKDDYYNHIKMMTNYNNNLMQELREAIVFTGGLKLVNLVENGNFIDGLEKWNHVSAQTTLSLDDEHLKVNYVTKVDNLMISYNSHPINYTNHKYYSIARFNPMNLTGEARLRHNTGQYTVRQSLAQNEYQTISTIFDGSVGGNITEFRVFANNTKAGDYFYLDYYIVLDLTATFGAGNEPSQQIMDAIIEEYGYFDELIINKDFIHEYELRQMKDAILRLGGTL
ncbi:hypothetical protein ACF3NG_06740 [Aerococcaceae bacterium WGS1372]